MIFEILIGVYMLWMTWLISTIMNIGGNDENAHRERMRNKT